ncbi:DNA-binding protein [Cokeromyces recurvatus]|uniref:DNA-binding protein n=1 Tax=Cokeromyces recurvatus TaxID=90255 RepID=UPI002220214C|nr:DNA-binding protein [Cokeromyces recurvatus]KAI7899999.1 DNA-binding protein [Cokeromyces recurvatus]
MLLFLDIIDLTCEFLETWLHQILYQCELYPKTIFKLQKKFEVPVHIAVHPDVQNYLSLFIQSCHSQLEKGDVKSISLNLIEENGDSKAIVEKFVFEINSTALKQSTSLPLNTLLKSESTYSIEDIEQYLRTCLIKIRTYESSSVIKKEPRTFSLSIERFEGGYPDLDRNTDWVPEDNLEQNWKHLVPLKTVSIDLFRFNIYVKVASSRKGKERCP